MMRSGTMVYAHLKNSTKSTAMAIIRTSFFHCQKHKIGQMLYFIRNGWYSCIIILLPARRIPVQFISMHCCKSFSFFHFLLFHRFAGTTCSPMFFRCSCRRRYRARINNSGACVCQFVAWAKDASNERALYTHWQEWTAPQRTYSATALTLSNA